MPFLTEELWQRLGTGGQSIALAAYPQGKERNEEAEREMGLLQDIVTKIRQERAFNKIDRSQKLTFMLAETGQKHRFYESHLTTIERVANVNINLSLGAFLLVADIRIDAARLRKENEQLEKVIANSKRQLDNADIVRKMPENVVATLQAKLADYESQLKKNLDALGE
jgi:valyl-tRNA synthetase